jgi:hypothetical protein
MLDGMRGVAKTDLGRTTIDFRTHAPRITVQEGSNQQGRTRGDLLERRRCWPRKSRCPLRIGAGRSGPATAAPHPPAPSAAGQRQTRRPLRRRRTAPRGRTCTPPLVGWTRARLSQRLARSACGGNGARGGLRACAVPGPLEPRSNRITSWPSSNSAVAQLHPATPAPTIATRIGRNVRSLRLLLSCGARSPDPHQKLRASSRRTGMPSVGVDSLRAMLQMNNAQPSTSSRCEQLTHAAAARHMRTAERRSLLGCSCTLRMLWWFGSHPPAAS